MKITGVDIYHVRLANPPQRNWFPTCIRISTDEGICGWGEAGIPVKAGKEAIGHYIAELSGMIVGMDPMDNEKIWNMLYSNSYWTYGGGALNFAAISSIDMALWDIKGKALGVPVYKLLGGKTNDALRSYASQTQLGWGACRRISVTPEEYAENAMEAVKQGFTAIKVDPFWTDDEGKAASANREAVPPEKRSDWTWTGFARGDQLTSVSNRVGAIRDAVGDKVDIVIEFHGIMDVNTSIQVGRELDQYKCLYYEEPGSSVNPRTTLEFKRGVHTPVATGERIGSTWGFQRLVEDRAIDVAQPDLGIIGGFTEMKKMCDFANLHSVGIQIHNMGGPIQCAATLHVETAIPNFVIHEHLSWNELEAFRRLGKYDYQPTNGKLQVPEIPGIGQELSEEAIAQSEILHVGG